ncbi:uncharacterized protein LOC127751404 [Frankliniella occidentalis]|uniref:Uncharacterized protein LOC127751404 n=1 Tax=Frankliniella occidentalis TaxID=133901 RepID=A0A9C6X7W8_FRAOC|nr:uncharacterized protein LOC127751404 [Frankliniella occidentalis]
MGDEQDQTEAGGEMPWAAFNEYFFFVREREKQNADCRCKLCPANAKLVAFNTSTFANLKLHLARVHGWSEDRLKSLNVSKGHGGTKRKATDQSGPNATDFFKKRKITQADVDRVTDRLVIREALPHRIVDSPFFKEAVLLGCPSTVRVGCRQTFKGRLSKHVDKMETNLKKQFDSVQYISTTADGWSKHRRGFLGMTVSWLDPDTLERKVAALALERLKGHHTHDKLAVAISKAHNQFNISGKVTKTTTDSASNFKKAFRVYGAKQRDNPDTGSIFDDLDGGSEDEDEDEDGVEGEDEEDDYVPVSVDEALDFADTDDDGTVLPAHQRCASHILNLVATQDVKAALDANVAYKKIHESTYDKLKVWWRRQNRSDLVADAIKDGLGVKLQVPGDTRWNSVFDAKSQIISLIDADEDKFNTTLDKAGLDRLTQSEIKFLREYVWVMHPVAAALDILQRDKDMYVGYIIPTILRLEAQLTMRRKMNGKDLRYCDVLARTLITAIRGPRRFQQYLEQEDLQLAAALLPQFKLNWQKDPVMRQNLKKVLIEKASSLSVEDDDNAGSQAQDTVADAGEGEADPTQEDDADAEAVDTPAAMDVGSDDSFFEFDSVEPAAEGTAETAEQEVERYFSTGPRRDAVKSCFAKGANDKTFRDEVMLKANFDYWM